MPRSENTSKALSTCFQGFHSFTCTPRVHPLPEWIVPASRFSAEDGPHLLTLEEWKAELAWVAG